MRRVHPDELPHCFSRARDGLRIPQRCRRRELRDFICQSSSGLMLRAQHGCEIRQPAGFLETGKEEILFELFVIILDERADNLRAVTNWIGR